jgi:hypothetical protein
VNLNIKTKTLHRQLRLYNPVGRYSNQENFLVDTRAMFFLNLMEEGAVT